MSAGKYSPTILDFCNDNENWFRDNCKNEGDQYDQDGFDMYGYDEDGLDRDGHDQWYYLAKEYYLDDFWDSESYYPPNELQM